MEMNRFVIHLIAVNIYEKEIAERRGINLNSEYGLKRMQEYREEERKDDELRASWSLGASNPGKFISYSKIQAEAARIRKERLKPYIEKAKIIYVEQQQEEKQKQNGPVLTKKLTSPNNTGNK